MYTLVSRLKRPHTFSFSLLPKPTRTKLDFSLSKSGFWLLKQRRRNFASFVPRKSEQLRKASDLKTQAEASLRAEDLVSAENYFRSSIDLRSRYVEDPNSDLLIAKTKINYAAVLHQLGKLEKSLHFFNESIPILESQLDEDSTPLAIGYVNFASLLFYLQRLDEAIDYQQKGVELLKQKRSDIFLAGSLNNLSGLLAAKGQYEEALRTSFDALKIFDEELGRYNDYSKTVFNNCYTLLSQMQMDDELRELEASWENWDTPVMEHAKPADIEKVSPFMAHFGYGARRAQVEPRGMMRPVGLGQIEVEDFLEELRRQKMSPYDHSVVQLLVQEYKAMKFMADRLGYHEPRKQPIDIPKPNAYALTTVLPSEVGDHPFSEELEQETENVWRRYLYNINSKEYSTAQWRIDYALKDLLETLELGQQTLSPRVKSFLNAYEKGKESFADWIVNEGRDLIYSLEKRGDYVTSQRWSEKREKKETPNWVDFFAEKESWLWLDTFLKRKERDWLGRIPLMTPKQRFEKDKKLRRWRVLRGSILKKPKV